MVGLALIVAVMVVFDLAALRFGADSRSTGPNDTVSNL